MKRKGYFGNFGGQFVPETLMPALNALDAVYHSYKNDREFKRTFKECLREYSGRPTPLYYADSLSRQLKGSRIYLKREDLGHTGSHKINNAIGQILLALRMGKKRVIAETGAGQHGVAVATACAKFNVPCDIYMGEVDIERQALNVFRMELLGARVIPVQSGGRTLKDAVNDAIRDWIANVKTTYYLLGSALGPHPYPTMVRDFQSVIGQETMTQIRAMEKRLPHAIVACVGGGSNAIGIFNAFIPYKRVKLIGVEAGGLGIRSGKHASRFSDARLGKKGVLHGNYTYVLQDIWGQILDTHSISAGLDYSAVGPEHAYLRKIRRAKYVHATDKEAVRAFKLLSETEGIIPALESAHAVAYTVKLAKKLKKNQVIIINLSGRGDKDIDTVKRIMRSGQIRGHI